MKNEIIQENRRELQNPYAHHFGNGDDYGAIILSLKAYIEELKIRKYQKNKLSEDEIEKFVIEIQRFIWNRYKQSSNDLDPIKLLDPQFILEKLDYQYIVKDTLSQYENKISKIAGMINNEDRIVYISNQFKKSIQRFTATHELGHAVMHQYQTGLHRDRPLDGSERTIKKSYTEWAADKFAVYYLMPKKLICREFQNRFLTQHFELNDDTRFTLNNQTKIKSLHDLSRLLAKQESYNRKNFSCLAHQFKVSTEAMAIRLEEIGLVKF